MHFNTTGSILLRYETKWQKNSLDFVHQYTCVKQKNHMKMENAILD